MVTLKCLLMFTKMFTDILSTYLEMFYMAFDDRFIRLCKRFTYELLLILPLSQD